MTASPDDFLKHTLAKDQLITLAGLAVLTLLCWAYLIHDARASADLPSCCVGVDVRHWGWSDFTALFLMWVIMMVGMMAPTAAPMVLMFASLNRHRLQAQRPYMPTALFLLGYLLIWTGFSVLATIAQWFLHRTSLMSPMMIATNRWLGATVLIGAGIFQWTPIKNRCLSHCRSPLDFLMTRWREGSRGALVMGLDHGLSCTGCCSLLMALLFVVGVMNLIWVAAITLLVLAEKLAPPAWHLARWTGAVLIIWGLAVCLHPFHG